MRILLAAFLVLMTAFAPARADEPLVLRAHVVASGSAVTLDDAFENAGDHGARAFAVAPAPGQSRAVPISALAGAVEAEGLAWTPPAGMRELVVTRASAAARPGAGAAMRSVDRPEAAVRRGDMLALTFAAPGIALTARGRALEDGGVGETIRVLNIQSEREIEARVVRAGEAAVSAR